MCKLKNYLSASLKTIYNSVSCCDLWSQHPLHFSSTIQPKKLGESFPQLLRHSVVVFYLFFNFLSCTVHWFYIISEPFLWRFTHSFHLVLVSLLEIRSFAEFVMFSSHCKILISISRFLHSYISWCQIHRIFCDWEAEIENSLLDSNQTLCFLPCLFK